ncbi:TetR/AcrR family transcriptional regulator [Streptomyces marincola]|uniref:TetR/AcrR family transcriptional regulator n=1 Tax=Streptomyces marincola TaxID=2878388 RepID=UPI001CF183F5|nr:TetR/AcrR family transcriptional regulator [Streptomyces marincola]UCM86870.1 TetR/AcrR family transcriptional regulator [Streptomyces marincola]
MAEPARRRPMRADARRNRDRIVAAAQEVFAADGARASLEEIARRAGVGSATLHRHFPTRRSLLDVVFHDRVEALCAKAGEHADRREPGDALVAWLGDLNVYAAASHGLVSSLLRDGPDADLLKRNDDCQAMITAAAGELLDRAQRAGAARPGVRVEDLLALVSALSLAAEQRDDDEGRANRLLDIAVNGVLLPR